MVGANKNLEDEKSSLNYVQLLAPLWESSFRKKNVLYMREIREWDS